MTHPTTGAETLLFEVERKDRNEPITLERARDIAADGRSCSLVINAQSQRVAVKIPAATLMTEDGTPIYRTRIVRPLEAITFTTTDFENSTWTPTDPATFAELWTKELTTIPEFVTRRFHIATGLLLPIWRLLPDDSPRVYRFQTDDGERVIGRLVDTQFLSALGARRTQPQSPEDILATLHSGDAVPLADNLLLTRRMVMHAPRYELTGFSASAVPLLKSFGLTAEIMSYKLRLFVPTGDATAEILARLTERYPAAG